MIRPLYFVYNGLIFVFMDSLPKKIIKWSFAVILGVYALYLVIAMILLTYSFLTSSLH